eukprot:1379014-Lingulodinium_polyedra.AAC.1
MARAVRFALMHWTAPLATCDAQRPGAAGSGRAPPPAWPAPLLALATWPPPGCMACAVRFALMHWTAPLA